jgi:hypothetical protein
MRELETNLVRQSTLHDPRACRLLRTIPGIGTILSLVLLYEFDTIDRFASVADFLSYARLVTPRQTSDGKVTGHGGGKIGNVHLKWAYSPYFSQINDPKNVPGPDEDPLTVYPEYSGGGCRTFRNAHTQWAEMSVHHNGFTTAWPPNNVTPGGPNLSFPDVDVLTPREQLGGPT